MFQTKKEFTSAELLAQRLRSHSIPAYANQEYKTKNGASISGDSDQVFIYDSHDKNSLLTLSFSRKHNAENIIWTGWYNYRKPVNGSKEAFIEIVFPDINNDFNWFPQIVSSLNYTNQGMIALHGEITFLQFMRESNSQINSDGKFEISPLVDIANCTRSELRRSKW